MLTEETRAEADRARVAFQKRLAAAEAVTSIPEIDWEYYAKALPEIDIAALRADFDKSVAAIPPVTYDEGKDIEAHTAKEAAWTGFAGYCAQRVNELKALADEQATHKLHRWYRRRQLYARFPGLYESLHNKVRGAWDVAVWAQYLAYRSQTVPLPWDPNHGEVTDAKRREIMLGVAAKAGVKVEDLGWTLPAETPKAE